MLPKACQGCTGQPGDPRIAEPILAVAFLEHVLQRPHAERQQGDPQPVDVPSTPLVSRGILEEGTDQERRHDADRDVDEEAPVPLVVVGDPPAERRAEGRRHDETEEKHRLDQPLLFRGKDLANRRLGGREQGRPACALDDAPEHERQQRM